MYTYTGRHIPTLNSYADALGAWERAHKWRSQYYTNQVWEDGYAREKTGHLHANDRRLGDSTKRYHGIIKYDDGDVALRYHDTDVVTWHPGDSFTVRAWPSRSTGAFATATTPHGISFNMIGGSGKKDALVSVGDRWYKMRNPCHFVRGTRTFNIGAVPRTRYSHEIAGAKRSANVESATRDPNARDMEWTPQDTYTFDWPVVLQPKARAACRARHLSDLEHWLRAAWFLRGDSIQYRAARGFESDRYTFDRLNDRSRWHEFIDCEYYRCEWDLHNRPRNFMSWNRKFTTDNKTWYINSSIKNAVDRARLAVYHYDECVITEEREFLVGYEALNLWAALHKRYDWLRQRRE